MPPQLNSTVGYFLEILFTFPHPLNEFGLLYEGTPIVQQHSSYLPNWISIYLHMLLLSQEVGK